MTMRNITVASFLTCALVLAALGQSRAAICLVAPKGKSIHLTSLSVFLTWDAENKFEAATLQPGFAGNADDFGMIFVTPAKPRLDEMPRDFFNMLRLFTVLDPMDKIKYKGQPEPWPDEGPVDPPPGAIRGIDDRRVFLGDYKIIPGERGADLFHWLKDNGYEYEAARPELEAAVKNRWFFTVMKFDAKQLRRGPDGSYEVASLTPTRFLFASERCFLPLDVSWSCVKDKLDGLFFIQAPFKADPGGKFSWQPEWGGRLCRAGELASDKGLNDKEKAWLEHLQPGRAAWDEQLQALREKKRQPMTLEWSSRLTDNDMAVLKGQQPFRRDSPAQVQQVKQLRILSGHLKSGQYLTRMHKAFTKPEVDGDLEFIKAEVKDKLDETEYTSLLPAKP